MRNLNCNKLWKINLTFINPSDYDSFRNPKQRKEKNNYTVETALDFLKLQGFDVSSIQDISK